MKIDDIPTRQITWARTFRLIRSIYPPIDLFEDIADPADWEALASAEAKSNPRVVDQIGNLALVPPERRVNGVGASYLMAPFTHVSKDRPGRFTDGSYGVYSAGDREEVALYEVAYHHGRFMAATDEAPGWTSQFRMLVGGLDQLLHDLSEVEEALRPHDWTHSQKIGAKLRAAGSNGVTYPSVRSPVGRCVGVFWPDLLPIPHQADHFDLHWNGADVDKVRNCNSGQIFAL
ncbi:RES family NAD+ phosphorylase [Maritalea mediterranea]|uniref:RES family NAD+ phosphorylase n=1 Tax=Maritalea mediterranea TaxID=2909667 RepID=A0ABS9E607_9HYPH|nr:RES family NAD+ phosphorylase [Maritalea mediterranea]